MSSTVSKFSPRIRELCGLSRSPLETTSPGSRRCAVPYGARKEKRTSMAQAELYGKG